MKTRDVPRGVTSMTKARGHHYIPQFLLKAFASRLAGDECFVEVFAKGRPPYQQNIRDAAKQRDFHGHPDQSPLESIMSERESLLSDIHRRLLQSGPAACTPTEIYSLIIHLLIRTKHLRETMTEVGETVFKSFEAPSKKTRRQLKHALERQARKALKESEHAPIIALLPKYRRQLLQRVAGVKAREFGTPQVIAEATNTLRQMIDFPAVAASSHISSLSKDHSFEKWHQRFEPLDWKIVESAEPEIILGDCGPVVKVKGDEHFNSLLAEMGDIVCLLLPIASRKLLIGTTESDVPAVDEVNSASASLSRQFFIAARRTMTEENYKQLIAHNSKLFTDADL
jgi:hypothetical protein